MTLPTFVGIGAERCGSTWLHQLLSQHSKIYMPVKRKELNFFSRNYDRGLEWYESFFPNSNDEKVYKAIGEISPEYLNYPECVARMVSTKSIYKLIAILRNPVKRAYSHYGHAIRLRGYSKSFEEFLLDKPDAINYGFYAKHLEPFLEFYDKNQLCCLVFEEAISDIASTRKILAQFLEVDLNEFPETAGLEKANETYVPKFKKLNSLANQIRNNLVDSDGNWDWVVKFAKKIGVQKALKLGAGNNIQPMSKETSRRLEGIFAEDIANLEKLLNISFTKFWLTNNVNNL